MDRAKHGDLDCLSELFERHHVGLFNFFFYQLKEKAKSEDLTQNVFEKLIKHRDKYDVNKPFKSWLYKIAWNEHNDVYRKKSLVLPGEEKFRHLTDVNQKFIEDEKSDQKARLEIAMGQLTPEQQRLIQLTRFEGLKYQEVADIMDSTVSNIKVKVHRTMKSLKNNYFKIRDL